MKENLMFLQRFVDTKYLKLFLNIKKKKTLFDDIWFNSLFHSQFNKQNKN